MDLNTLPGESHPLGATVYPAGVNFCLYSKHARIVELLLFKENNAPQPSDILVLERETNRSHYYWHIFVPGLTAGQVYAYRVHGPFEPDNGHRFDANKVLLDPYGKAIVGSSIYSRNVALQPGDNCAQALRNVVIDNSNYEWEDDHPLRIPYSQSIIYEMHVRGFTRNPNSDVKPDKRGTYAGLIEKIPYLKSLGITAVELLPVHYFDCEDAKYGLTNYWGYSTINFFTPHRIYSSDKSSLGPLDEFRDMVKALHKAGIEVILDVVFNHTTEGDERGPTLCFRGIDNATYYILEADNLAHYKNYSGCGNTLRGNHPIVARLILDSLRYWVSEMHVDGFRFDLASILTRNASGTPIKDRQTLDLLWVIVSDPILAGTKLIAEAWDAAGLYDVGRFVKLTGRFAEWNGPFRDDIRRFVKGDVGMVPCLAARIIGSPDIYPRIDIDTNLSINFVTCHDGFSLNDLVSYNEKHNEANGENNCDGCNDNLSWNCGVEGETDNSQIHVLRLQQMKNILTILFISQGTPMILMGDEVSRTGKGNNNVYCQDNELSWFDWDDVDRQFDLWCFVKKLIHFTQGLELFRQEQRLEVTYTNLDHPQISWHGTKLRHPDWSDHSRCFAFSMRHPDANEHLHVMLNAYWKSLEFELPVLDHGDYWHRIIDTALPSSESFCQLDEGNAVKTNSYHVRGQSSVVLMAKPML